MSKKKLAELQKEEDELNKMLSENRGLQTEIIKGQFYKKYGLKEGDKIKYLFGSTLFHGIIHSISVYPSASCINYFEVKRDGTLSKYVTTVNFIPSKIKKVIPYEQENP